MPKILSREEREQKIARGMEIINRAKASARDLTAEEKRDLNANLADLDASEMAGIRTNADIETRGVYTGPGTPRPAAYTADNAVEGRTGELLRPDQSMSSWLEKRKGKTLAHDVDWNAYWAQRMKLTRPGAELRALGEDTASGAGAGQPIVPQEWSTTFVDILRPNLVVGQAGCSILPLEEEIYNLPQYVSDVSPQWLAEDAQLTLDANPQFSTVQFNAMGSFTDVTLVSRQLAEDTNQAGGLSGLLQDTIGKKYQRVIDQVAFYGASGSTGNPGLLNETGLIVQTLGGTANVNGQAPVDTQFLSTALEAVRNANAEASAIVANPKTLGTVSRLNASAYAKYWDFSADVADVPWLYSTALASNEALGTGTNLSSLYMGDWSRMIIGMRVDLDVRVLTERYADFNQIGLLSYMRFSIRTTHPESFVRVKGIVTT
jgi:HK97 family phage major capsid protein